MQIALTGLDWRRTEKKRRKQRKGGKRGRGNREEKEDEGTHVWEWLERVGRGFN